jgi:hypothetical protein
VPTNITQRIRLFQIPIREYLAAITAGAQSVVVPILFYFEIRKWIFFLFFLPYDNARNHYNTHVLDFMRPAVNLGQSFTSQT